MEGKVGINEMMGIFAMYIEKTLGLPPVGVRYKAKPVKARVLPPNPEERVMGEEEDGEEEYVLIEESLTDAMRAELDEVTFWEEDLSLYIMFNALTFEWSISFAPNQDIGFLVTGTDLQKVVETVYSNLENRMYYNAGHLKDVDIDAEWQLYGGED